MPWIAVSDRDYSLEFLSDASISMMHLSRWAEEFAWWNSSEFSYIAIDDSFCTGSSIMPQKKNPDMAELIRGKVGRVYGDLMQLSDRYEGNSAWPITRTSRRIRRAFSMRSTPGRRQSRSLRRCWTRPNSGWIRSKSSLSKGFLNATDIAEHFAKAGHSVPGSTCYRRTYGKSM